jgi:ABC-type multidrug transport system fused ATPase/permease subunit
VISSFFSQTAIPLALPILLAELTNSFQRATQTDLTKNHSIFSSYLLWLAITVSSIPLAIIFRLAQTRMDNQMEKQVRQELFRKVIEREPEFFHQNNPGKLANILMQTSVEAQQAVRSLTVDPLLQLASVCIATLLIIQQLEQISGNVHIVWLVVTAMVIVGAASAVLTQIKGQRPVDQAQRDYQMQRFSLAGLADSTLSCVEEIQAMGAGAFFSKMYASSVDKLLSLKTRQVLTMELVNSAIGFPTQALLAILYSFIVFQAVHGKQGIPLGVFVALAGLTPQLMQPFKSFAVLGIIAGASWPAVEVVANFLDHDMERKYLAEMKDIEEIQPTLEVQDLSFQYHNGHRVFTRMSFKIPSKKTTALVARMGQGKTTFFRLAMGFYDPESGEIHVGGLPTTSFTFKSLRRHVTMMSQFPSFFHGTVRDNFLIANADATDAEIRRVCEQTGMWSILENALGEDPLNRPFAAGKCISGGQQRLFALTRCLLRNPSIFFLDEPTTNMSNDEKSLLIPLMRKACDKMTVVVVDHDLNWLMRFCDHFIVLDGGKVVQEGSGEELAANHGLFRELLIPSDDGTLSVSKA